MGRAALSEEVYMKEDLKHLKWKLMKRGIPEEEANGRISAIQELNKKDEDREERKPLNKTKTTKTNERRSDIKES